MFLCLGSPSEVVEVENLYLFIISDRVVRITVIENCFNPIVQIPVKVGLEFIIKVLVEVFFRSDFHLELIVHKLVDGGQPLLTINDLVNLFPKCFISDRMCNHDNRGDEFLI